MMVPTIFLTIGATIKIAGNAIGHACANARSHCITNCSLMPVNSAVSTPAISIAISSDMTNANTILVYFLCIFMLVQIYDSFFLKHMFKVFGSIAAAILRHFFWRTLGNDRTAAITPFWPHIHYPVCGFDHIQVVLNDDNGIARIT